MVKVIINADDFGYSKGINKGILECIENGVVTSTSVLVNRGAANQAKKLTKYKNISIGLHLDLTEEKTRFFEIPALLFWTRKRVQVEFDRQIAKFEEIVGKPPDHLDGHSNVHILPSIWPVVREYAETHKIPVRGKGYAVFHFSFFGRSFFNMRDRKKVSAENLIRILKSLPPGKHEIMCHPGYVDNDLIATGTTYLKHRTWEIKALTSGKIKNYLQKNNLVRLLNWSQIE